MIVVLLFVFLCDHISYSFIRHLNKSDDAFGYTSTTSRLTKGSSSNLNLTPAYSGPCVVRKFDQRLVCHPDVMFIGSSKCGTSSIASYILQHPMLANVGNWSSNKKFQLNPWSVEGEFQKQSNEGHNFDWADKRGTLLSQNIALAKKMSAKIIRTQPGYAQDIFSQRPLGVEYTPNYMIVEDVPLTLKLVYTKKHLNAMKFIVCLRDPIKRTISSWISKKLKQPDRIPDFAEVWDTGKSQANCIMDCYNSKGIDISKALQHDENGDGNTVNNNNNMNTSDDAFLNATSCSFKKCIQEFDKHEGRGAGFSMLAHVVKSMYVYQLHYWFTFFDRRNFLIFSLEEFQANEIGTLERICDFLGLNLFDTNGKKGYRNRDELVKILRVQKNVTPFNNLAAQISSRQLIEMREWFKPHTKALFKLLGRDLGF
jgi:hypothetical protein